MAYLVWTKELEVGHPEIDEQHKRLLLLTDVMVGPLSNAADQKLGVAHLQTLIDFTQEHFTFEEDLMRSSGYQDVELHAKYHASLLTELRAYCSKAQWGRNANPDGLVGFLWNWFVAHIDSADRDLVAWLGSRGPDGRQPVVTASPGVPGAENGMHAVPDPGDLDFTKAFDSPAQPAPSLEASTEAVKEEATAAAAELESTGYYITIAHKAPKVAPLQQDGRYSILCIDDDTGLLKILATKLSLDGFSIRTAFDRQSIVAELQKRPPPHLILLDVGLPGINGFDLLQKLRRHPGLGSVPVIMLTGHVSPESVLHGMANGADGYVSKPFQFEALGTAIETVLGIR